MLYGDLTMASDPFKVGLAVVGLFGALFYVTFDPITVISYTLYLFMVALMVPLLIDLL